MKGLKHTEKPIADVEGSSITIYLTDILFNVSFTFSEGYLIGQIASNSFFSPSDFIMLIN